jgi:hypothetical protein
MGMTGGLVRAPASRIQELREKPGEVAAFLDGNQWASPVRQVVPRNVILRWLPKLLPVTIEEVDPTAVAPPGANLEPDPNICDLDKGWQGLHFLFTGTAWEGEEPACYLIRGGEEIDGVEQYSSVRALSPDRVRAFASFLSSLSREELTRHYDPARMMALEIYPEIWDRKGEEPTPLDYLLDLFDELQPFVIDAAKAGDAAIVYLT